MTKQEILKQCNVEGNIVKLPDVQLERKLYTEVATALNLIGGKWKGGKIAGFVFDSDPSELLEQISQGENRNLKKEFQFFPTPHELAVKLVKYAEIKNTDRVLEPSAGQGAIIKAILEVYPDHKGPIDYCELMETNLRICKRDYPVADNISFDFFNIDESYRYDKIIANPPFSKNQDIDHVYKMWDCLEEGGTIVTITSKHWQLSSNKKETQFREFLSANVMQLCVRLTIGS